MVMEFYDNGRLITMVWNSDIDNEVSHHQPRRLVATDAVANFYHLMDQNVSFNTLENIANNNMISIVISRFSHVFEVPLSSPPLRDIQHHIHLVQGTVPINVCPY